MFLEDLRSRLENRIQLTSDEHHPYLEAVDSAFGEAVDYAMLIKTYGYSPEMAGKQCLDTERKAVRGHPNPAWISISGVERNNLTMRSNIRQFGRLTNAFSKNVENHIATIALHFMDYNFCRSHRSIGVTPARAAGVTDRIMEVSDIVDLVED